MRTRAILALILGAFVVISLSMVARQSFRPAHVESEAAVASVIPAPPVSRGPAPSPDAATVEVTATPGQLAREPAGSAPPRRDQRSGDAPGALVTPEAAAPARVRKIAATYFHGNIRCATCRKIEAYSREAIEEGFPSHISAGSVEFRTVNVDDPENRHFIDDYQLVTRSVVVTEEIDGAVARWAKLDEVWTLVADRTACVGYVQDGVREYLESR